MLACEVLTSFNGTYICMPINLPVGRFSVGYSILFSRINGVSLNGYFTSNTEFYFFELLANSSS
jgi:hypothetical protein